MVKSKNNVNERYRFKRKLLELLLREKRISRATSRDNVTALFYFIDFLLEIPEDMTKELQNEIIPFMKKEDTEMAQPMDMELSPTLKGIVELERAEGKEEGKKEIAKSMLEEGLSIQLITKVTKLSKEEIEKIKEGH
jgi:predicted transposase/invertase (TIGR01784 family)